MPLSGMTRWTAGGPSTWHPSSEGTLGQRAETSISQVPIMLESLPKSTFLQMDRMFSADSEANTVSPFKPRLQKSRLSDPVTSTNKLQRRPGTEGRSPAGGSGGRRRTNCRARALFGPRSEQTLTSSRSSGDPALPFRNYCPLCRTQRGL